MLDHPMAKNRADIPSEPKLGRKAYAPPADIRTTSLSQLLKETGRPELKKKQFSLLRSKDEPETDDANLYFSGDLSLLDRPCIAVVGSRDVSNEGLARARRLSRELVEAGFVVVSGLALGIDAAAHSAAIDNGGHTIGVIGTPLDKAYPKENSDLQEAIHLDHLLVSPFKIGEKTFKSSFPKRNRVMAALSDATVIIEASDTSGSLHQAAECVRLGRWLFIAKSLADNPNLTWPSKFLNKPRAATLMATADLVEAVIKDRE